jgi:hypothetical protein
MDNPPAQGSWIETPSVKSRKTSDDAGVPLRGLFLRPVAALSGTPVMQSGGCLVSGTSPHLRAGLSMQNPGNNANDSHRGNTADHKSQQSQDAVRHQKNALHHKFHNGQPSSESDQKADQQSQARAQQDSVDMQQIEGQQPEIPKVGSLDAPGG